MSSRICSYSLLPPNPIIVDLANRGVFFGNHHYHLAPVNYTNRVDSVVNDRLENKASLQDQGKLKRKERTYELRESTLKHRKLDSNPVVKKEAPLNEPQRIFANNLIKQEVSLDEKKEKIDGNPCQHKFRRKYVVEAFTAGRLKELFPELSPDLLAKISLLQQTRALTRKTTIVARECFLYFHKIHPDLTHKQLGQIFDRASEVMRRWEFQFVHVELYQSRFTT